MTFTLADIARLIDDYRAGRPTPAAKTREFHEAVNHLLSEGKLRIGKDGLEVTE